MSDNNPTNLILRHRTMQHQTKRHKHPRQIRRCKHQQPQKAQAGIRIAPRPDIHQCTAQRPTQKRHRYQRTGYQEYSGGIEQQPAEFGWRAAGGLFEEAGVALEEKDVEEEIEG